MPGYTLSHAADDEDQDCPEIVGSKDLRESFADNGRIRGSFFINGYEFHQFESNSIDNLISLLNAKSGNTHVKASIDDGYHLVLEANSPAPISIRAGEPYVDVPAAVGGDTADQVLAKLKAEADKGATKGDDGKPKNNVLELLGLEATDDAVSGAPVGEIPPGPTADERKKARDERANWDEARDGPYRPGAVAGQTATLPTEQSAPITGSGDGAKMADGRDRTGQGAGYSTKPDGTPPVSGTPASDAIKQMGSDPALNVPHQPAPQSP